MGISCSISKKDKSQNRRKELLMGRKAVDIDLVDELRKSVCKIKYKKMENNIYGTGFFMDYKSLKCLISANHIIRTNLLKKSIEIEIYNKENFNLILNNRYIKFFEDLDISLIEIKESDEINNKGIQYLKHDLNYKEGGYNQYKLMEIICLQYPGGRNLRAQCGKIIDIKNKYEFEHDIPTEPGSSGSPIILTNIKKIIGLHNFGDLRKNINIGTFIGEIFNENNNNLKQENKNDDIDKNNNNIKKDINNILDLNDKRLGNEGLQILINYNNITELYLHNNEISDITILEKVKYEGLEILDLSSNKISDIKILENSNFKKLKSLILQDNQISDITILEKVKFERLEILDLSYNKISNINVLENVNFQELKSLNLNCNNISDIKILEKVNFEKLELLDLYNNEISDIKILENVKFKELKTLKLNFNQISEIKILENVDFKELKTLKLNSNNEISDINILENLNFSKLEELSLDMFGNKIINVLENANFHELKILNFFVKGTPFKITFEKLTFSKLKQLSFIRGDQRELYKKYKKDISFFIYLIIIGI